MIRPSYTLPLLLCASAFTGRAATAQPAPTLEVLSVASSVAVAPIIDAPAPRIVAVPVPLPLPGQLKPLGTSARPAEPASPATRILQANAAARMEPARDGFINAMQVWPFVDGALYQLYTAPSHVTDIALEPGERLVGPGPVAAGDTVRWIIGDTESGTGASKQVHILVKPIRPDIGTTW